MSTLSRRHSSCQAGSPWQCLGKRRRSRYSVRSNLQVYSDVPMKAYIATTGLLFAAISVAHIWRIAEEGGRLAREPFFVVLTLVSVGLTLWAGRLLRAGSASA